MPPLLARIVLLLLVGVSHSQADTHETPMNYCKMDIYNNTVLQDGDTFDYIVVGAGGAGAPAAARLALSGADVLLVEAGGDPSVDTKIPGLCVALLGTKDDWMYGTISNNISCKSSRGQGCLYSRGKCLGGSTSINGMKYVRGNRRDYDDLGIEGWVWKDLKPYFLKYEGLQDLDKLPTTSVPYHNTTGTMKMGFFTDPNNTLQSRIVKGFEALNFPFNRDVNADSQIGVSQVIGFVYQGERMSTGRGYLARDDVKSVLKVAKETRCTGVILNQDNSAIGISVVKEGQTNQVLRLYARKEIILSAGAIGTPQILMLSGIGPAAHLNSLNITVRADLPVGADVSEHVRLLMYMPINSGNKTVHEAPTINSFMYKLNSDDIHKWCTAREGPAASIGLSTVFALINTRCYDFDQRKLIHNSSECEVPTVELLHEFIDKNQIPYESNFTGLARGLEGYITSQITAAYEYKAIVGVAPMLLRPYSRGTIRLASKDATDDPAIFPNFLADERDIEELLRSITILEHLVETPEYKAHNASILHLILPGCPEYEADREGYWRCYCQHMTYSGFHAVGSAPLGAVLDARLGVRGVSRLRVADLSALPEVPRGNTAAVAIAIGERVADFILQDTK